MPTPLRARLTCGLVFLLLKAASAQATDTLELPPVEVIGTRLGRPLNEAPTVVTIVDRAEIERRAPGNLSELLRELPELAVTGITENVAINSTHGVTALDLRGLGAGNTLVLVDGRRTTVSANAFDGTLFVDLNRFPPGLVERVEILKGGASAVYGADAVAGVINIVTRRRPAGGELFVSHGNAFATDAAESHASVVAGVTRGRLALTARASLFARNALASRDRYFSRTANLVPRFVATDSYYAGLPTAQIAAFDGRSLTSPSARLTPVVGQINGQNGVNIPGLPAGAAITALPGTGGVPGGTLAQATPSFAAPFLGVAGGQFNATAAATFQSPEVTRGDPNARNLYDFNQTFGLVPEATRAGAGLRLEYALPGGATAFAEVSAQRNRSRIDLLPVGVSAVVPRTNPYNPFGIDVSIAWRLAEAGPRRSLAENDNYSLLAGLRAPTTASTAWETAVHYSRDRFSDSTVNWLSRLRTLAALARTDATALNPFGGPRFKHDAAVIDPLKVSYRPTGHASLLGFDGQVARDFWSLPGGPIRAAAYLEHRREIYGFSSDAASLAGDILGLGMVPTPSEWHRAVSAIAAEVRLPLLARSSHDAPPRLAVEASARYERAEGGFVSGGRPTLGLVFFPSEAWTLRASRAATFRAPTLFQLFSPQSEGFYNSVPDPRRPAALTGDPYDGPNVSRLVRSGGNPALKAETGHVTQVGLAWAPRHGAARGLSVEINWFRYELENLISGVAPTYVLDNELGGLGHLVLRDPGNETYVNTTGAPLLVLTGPAGEKTAVAPGQSFSVPGRLQRIDSYIVNLSRRRLVGTDINLRYARDLAALGRLTINTAVTCNIESSYAYDAGSPLTDGTGTMGSPAWRGRGSLAWEKQAWQASGDLRQQGSHFKPYRVLNLQAGYRFPATAAWLRDTSVSLGIDDVLEDDVPLINDPPIGYSYSNVARPQGRFWRVSLKREW